MFLIYFIIELPQAVAKGSYEKYASNLAFYIGAIFASSIGHALPFLLGVFEFKDSSIRLHWRHAAYHYVLLCAYNVLNAAYSIANKTQIYQGLDWYKNPFQASWLFAIVGPLWFGNFYLMTLI